MGQIPRWLLLVAGVAAAVSLVLAFETRQFLAIGLAAAGVAFVALTTFFHRPAAAAVRAFTDLPLRLQVWGAPLRGEADEAYRLETVQAFGAGLLIWARSEGSDERILIKVAQPGDLRRQENGLAIGRARYVQVNKSTVPAVPGAAALELFRRLG